jgi:hypothetical protein
MVAAETRNNHSSPTASVESPTKNEAPGRQEKI